LADSFANGKNKEEIEVFARVNKQQGILEINKNNEQYCSYEL
jgi:hypothetical protein